MWHDTFYFASLFPTELALLFGLIVGSFLNVVIYRYPKMIEQRWREACQNVDAELATNDAREPPVRLDLALPASHCPHCEHPLRWYDNIPLLSWVLLRGRCRYCQEKISLRYPLVEATTALLFAICGHLWGISLLSGAMMSLCALLLCAACIDWKTLWLPDSLTQPVLWLGLLCACFEITPLTLHQAFIGVITGYLSFWLLARMFRMLTGREGLGGGDIMLFAALGAWTGAYLLPLLALLSALGGIATALIRRQHTQHIPFGPWLACAGIIILLFEGKLSAVFYPLF